MTLNQLNILINDTFVAGTILNIERTENANPVLKYNGADDEYQPIMASELTFNMLVPDAADGKFLHLFTGNETRYQVQLENALTGAILWTGFLLPDFYSEPYENSSFFVSFTATDGLARLKNKYLSDDFYKDKKTLPQILTACLKLTGSFFNTAIAPAITSAVVALKQYEILVPTALYIKKDKKQNAYEILEDLLTVMGCRLFLWGEMWHIIGINRFNDLIVNVEFYGHDGGFISYPSSTITRPENTVTFEAHPSISAIPPFKDVIIDWQKDERINIFPLDVVFQKNADIFSMKYWTQIGSSFTKKLSYNTVSIPQVSSSKYGLYYLNILGTVSSVDVDNQYLILENPIGVIGTASLEETIDLEIEAVMWFSSDPSVKLSEGAYRNKLIYDLKLNNTTLVSNNPIYSLGQNYDFKFDVGETEIYNFNVYWPVKCTLKVEGILFDDYGDVNIKLHPFITVVSAPNPIRVVYINLNATYHSNNENGPLKKIRDIDFTTSKEITTAWGFDKSDLIENKLLISPLVSIPPVDIYTPSTQHAINIENFNEVTEYDYYDAFPDYSIFTIGISKKDYFLLKKYPNKLYVKYASGPELIKIIDYIVVEDNTNPSGYIIRTFDKDLSMGIYDDLYLDIPAETITITDDRYLLGAWKRVGETENIDYNEALARIYHSTIGEVKFKIEGIALEVINPLELFQFNYFAPRNYNATSLTMNLSAGTTTVILIESVKAIIEDYESEVVLIEDIIA